MVVASRQSGMVVICGKTSPSVASSWSASSTVREHWASWPILNSQKKILRATVATMVSSTRSTPCSGYSVISPTSVATPQRSLSLARVLVPSAVACSVPLRSPRVSSMVASVRAEVRLPPGATPHARWAWMPHRRELNNRVWPFRSI